MSSSAIAPGLPPALFPAASTVAGLKSLDDRYNKPGFSFSTTVLVEYRNSKAIRGSDEALHNIYDRAPAADKLRIVQEVFSKHCSSHVPVAGGSAAEGWRDRRVHVPVAGGSAAEGWGDRRVHVPVGVGRRPLPLPYPVMGSAAHVAVGSAAHVAVGSAAHVEITIRDGAASTDHGTRGPSHVIPGSEKK